MPPQLSREDIDAIKGVPHIGRGMRLVITLFGSLLGAVFVWRHLDNLSAMAVMQSINPNSVITFALIIVYFSWVAGINLDVSMQESVYIYDSEGGKTDWSSILFLIIFLIASFTMLSVSRREEWLLFALTLFSIISIILIRDVVRRTAPMITGSRKIYSDSKDYARLEQLNLLEHYIAGKWVWRRAIGLLVLLALIDVIGFSPDVRNWIMDLVKRIFGAAFAAALNPLLSVLLIIMFLILAEGSQWLMRLKTRISIFLLGSLGRHYHFERLDASKPAGRAGTESVD